MAKVYTTISGEQWDEIAKKVYGSEKKVSFLMSNNQDKLDYFIFPEGVKLIVEDLPTEESTLPVWRQ
ncbi:MAG: tail protein X [Lachnospiraceae bacterium]|nr:tail protein X [Lachnospiraceae bacterium]